MGSTCVGDGLLGDHTIVPRPHEHVRSHVSRVKRRSEPNRAMGIVGVCGAAGARAALDDTQRLPFVESEALDTNLTNRVTIESRHFRPVCEGE